MMRSRNTSRKERAFAMLMALLVVAVTSIGVLTVVQRQNVQAMAAARMVDQYQLHHGVRGLEEVLSSWLLTLSSLDVRAVLEAEPEALTIELADGNILTISLVDGQGFVRRDSVGLDSGSISAARAASEELWIQLQDPAAFQELTRKYGPAAISQNTAGIEALRAVAAVVLHDGDYLELAERWSQARLEERLTVAESRRIAEAAGASEERSELLNTLFADSPSIWRMDVEVRAPGPAGTRGPIVALYTGTVQLVQTASIEAGRRILEFRPIDPEDLQEELRRRAMLGTR